MRFTCSLLAFAMLASCSAARADSMDYKGNILDPTSTPGSYPTNVETADTFGVTFGQCQVDELPGGNTGDGCFAVSNRSGDTWIGMTLTIPNVPPLDSQSTSCNTDPNSLAFSAVGACGLDPSGDFYTLQFTDGSFPSGTSNTLFIVETGIPYNEFPSFTATATVASVATTPEPSSLLLMSTGLLGVALLSRRQILQS